MKVFGITAPMSGSGKTTVVLGLLHKLRNSISFKIGPDYIDGYIHSAVSGRRAINIDRWLQGRIYRNILGLYGKGYDYGIVEGVMGMYDSGSPMDLSTHYYFKNLHIPYILVIDVSKLAESAYHISRGFFSKNLIGVIINGYASDKHLEIVEAPFRKRGIRIIGRIPYREEMAVPERHLGLNTDILPEKIRTVAALVASYLDVDFTESLHDLPSSGSDHSMISSSKYKIYIARDNAFNFYYPTSLDTLMSIGRISFFSPLKGEIPEDPDLIYLGGGYPELYAEKLSKNTKTLREIRNASGAGIPIIGECGGLMYLEKDMIVSKKRYPMTGIFSGKVVWRPKLTLGYTKLLAKDNSVIFREGDIVQGHEFHYSFIEDRGRKVFKNLIGKGIDGHDGLSEKNTIGSYSHIDFIRYKKRIQKLMISMRR